MLITFAEFDKHFDTVDKRNKAIKNMLKKNNAFWSKAWEKAVMNKKNFIDGCYDDSMLSVAWKLYEEEGIISYEPTIFCPYSSAYYYERMGQQKESEGVEFREILEEGLVIYEDGIKLGNEGHFASAEALFREAEEHLNNCLSELNEWTKKYMTEIDFEDICFNAYSEIVKPIGEDADKELQYYLDTDNWNIYRGHLHCIDELK